MVLITLAAFIAQKVKFQFTCMNLLVLLQRTFLPIATDERLGHFPASQDRWTLPKSASDNLKESQNRNSDAAFEKIFRNRKCFHRSKQNLYFSPTPEVKNKIFSLVLVSLYLITS
jgi:hypothetical protein